MSDSWWGGDPCDLGGVKFYGNPLTWLKIKKKSCFGISTTKQTQKWVVEVCWPILGLLAVLYCTVCSVRRKQYTKKTVDKHNFLYILIIAEQTKKSLRPCSAVQSRVPHCPVSIFATPAIPAPYTVCKPARTRTRQQEFGKNSTPNTTCKGWTPTTTTTVPEGNPLLSGNNISKLNRLYWSKGK